MLDQEAVAGRSSPADATIPESVREVMADRVAGLTPALGELLQLIAVSPRGIALPVLRAAALMDDEPLLGALDEGLRTGMLDEIRDASLVYCVRHELLRRTVYERAELVPRGGAAPARGRGAGGDALRVGATGSSTSSRSTSAPPLRSRGTAARSNTRSRRLRRQNAPSPSPRRQVDSRRRSRSVSPTFAPRRTYAAGRGWRGISPDGPPMRSRASPPARRPRASAATKRCYARAAIGFETACWRPGIDDPRAVALLREAALEIAAEPSAQRVLVLAHLSRALAYRGNHSAAGERWSQAVAMARLVGDPAALMVALSHAAWTRGSRALDEILDDLTEADELARTLPHDYLSDVARGMRVALLIEAFEHRRGSRAQRRAPRAVRASRPALPRAGRRATRGGPRALRWPARRRRSGGEAQR